MDLSAFANQYLGPWPTAVLPYAGPASQELTSITQNETRAQPLIASLFWQAFTSLDAYTQLLSSLGLRPEDRANRQELVVRHSSTPFWSRYDLMVLDPGFSGGQPAVSTVEVRPQELAEAAEEYWNGLEERNRMPGELGGPSLVGKVVAEAAQAQRFQVIVTRPPSTIPTAIAPTPAWEVVPQLGEGSNASAGVVAIDGAGRHGVTSANHAFAEKAHDVTVAGVPGTICSRHPVSDSCFIAVSMANPVGQAVQGPLSGISPGEGQIVTFHGTASGSQSTFVTGWDKGIPFEIRPWGRLRVLTKPATNPGDSGAALLDGTGKVIGFAFDRTGYDAPVEYSAWIWAEFIYAAHGLH
jgi:hypothetical protein